MKNTGSTSPPPQYQNVQDGGGRIGTVVRHSQYFQGPGDDMAILQVENKLFRVSTRWLQANSPRMKQLLQNSASSSVDESRAIRVTDVFVEQFETLLHFIENGIASDFSMPAKFWVHLLAASHYLEIASIKPRAVNEVFYKHYRSFDAVTQLHLYEHCAVERVALRAAVRQLVIRSKSLDAKEMARLSHALAARMVSMRESYLRAQLGAFGSIFAGQTLDALVDGWVTNG